jgi:hypothetical protein
MRWLARVVPVVVVATVFTSCSTRPGLSNGSVTACYRAIPTARAALHDQKATLIGVHRVPTDVVRAHLPASARAYITAENDSVVCAVAFKGTFSPGQVDLAPATEQGPYALVLLTSRHLQLVAAAVLDHLPKGLGARTV